MANAAVARDVVCTLRQQIAKIEGRLAERFDAPQEPAARGLAPVPACSAFLLRSGVERFDDVLGVGTPAAGLTEIHGIATRDAGAAAGFALALLRVLPEAKAAGPLLWIGTSEVFREAGRPYAPGLAERFGIGPQNLLIAEAAKLTDALWIAEEAARLDTLRAVILEVRGSSQKLDLTVTRRLHRRALMAGHPLFLIREAGEAEPTAAPVRLVVAPAKAASRVTLAGPLVGSIGPPAFEVTISKSRTAIPAAFTLEWINGAFHERRKPSAKDNLAVVSIPAGGPDNAAAPREIVAFPQSQQHGTADLQPARQQHPAHRGARRTG
jgi:protein ImuA